MRSVLLEHPGIAAVEELRVEQRWGRARSVTACISIRASADAREVCDRAAQALLERLRLTGVCLVSVPVSRETPT